MLRYQTTVFSNDRGHMLLLSDDGELFKGLVHLGTHVTQKYSDIVPGTRILLLKTDDMFEAEAVGKVIAVPELPQKLQRWGTIKDYNDHGYGFINCLQSSEDIHFTVYECNLDPDNRRKGVDVSYYLAHGLHGKTTAVRVRKA